MMWVDVEYPAYHRQWTVEGLSDSCPFARLRLAGNQNALRSGDAVNAGILS